MLPSLDFSQHTSSTFLDLPRSLASSFFVLVFCVIKTCTAPLNFICQAPCAGLFPGPFLASLTVEDLPTASFVFGATASFVFGAAASFVFGAAAFFSCERHFFVGAASFLSLGYCSS
jgi:hypothetical protein